MEWFVTHTRHLLVNPTLRTTTQAGFTGVHELQFALQAGTGTAGPSRRPHRRTGRVLGRPATAGVPPGRGTYYTAVGVLDDDYQGQQEEEEHHSEEHHHEEHHSEEHHHEEHDREFGSQGHQFGSGGGWGDSQGHQFQSGGGWDHHTTGWGQTSSQQFHEHYSTGWGHDTSSWGHTMGQQEHEQSFTLMQTPPAYQSQTPDTQAQEHAHDRGKARGQMSQTRLFGGGFEAFAGSSTLFRTASQEQHQSQHTLTQTHPHTQEEEEEEPQPPRRGRHRAARDRPRECGTGGRYHGH